MDDMQLIGIILTILALFFNSEKYHEVSLKGYLFIKCYVKLFILHNLS